MIVYVVETDSDGYIMKAKARLVARGSAQQSGVDYFNTFAPTPKVLSTKVALVITVQNDGPLYRFDVVTQSFVQAQLDPDVYMEVPYGCGKSKGKVVKLDRPLDGIEQAGRQQCSVLCQALVDEHGKEQCRADPCVYRKIVEGVVGLSLVLHVDDILVSGKKEACDELHNTLNVFFVRPKFSGS